MAKKEKKIGSPDDQKKPKSHRSTIIQPQDIVDTPTPTRHVTGSPICVQIIDSSEAFCDGLGRAVERAKDMRLISSARTAARVLDDPASLEVDVALIDVDLPDQSGIELGRHLLERKRGMAVVLLSHWDWDVYLVSAFAIGAAGFLVHSLLVTDLLNSIRSAFAGPIYTVDQLQRIQAWNNDMGARLSRLRRREWQMLWRLAGGVKNKDLALQMSVAENTVEKHVTSILNKLDLNSRSMLMAFIFLHHLDALSQIPEEQRPFYISSGKKTTEDA